MKRLVWGAVVIGAATAIVLLTRAATSAEDAIENSTFVRVARRDIASVVKATGVIKPRVGADVRVGSRISGVVKRLYVQIGDTVAKGQLLAQLDDRDFVARRGEASAALQQGEVNRTYAKLELERSRTLNASGNLPPSQLEIAERAFALAEQQVAGARASLEYATAQLEYTRITVPIAGVVASVATQEGETVAASFAAPTFLTLLDPSRLEAWTYVDETDIGRIRMGQTARFTVDTYGDEAFEGRVTTVYPQAEIRDNVVNYVTVVTFKQPRGRVLRPEMTTTVRIALETRENVLTVPVGALRSQGGRAQVLIPRDGASEPRPVTTGMRDDNYVEITSGLREGDSVIVAGGNNERGRR